MRDNISTPPDFETTVNSDDVIVAEELQLVITIATLPRNGGEETVVTKEFRVPHNNQILPENQGRRMILHMLQGTPLDRGITLLRWVEDLISDERLRRWATNQQMFFYFYALQDEDSPEEDAVRFLVRTRIMETASYTNFLRESRETLWRCSAVEKVKGAVDSSEHKSSCSICLTDISGDDEEIAGRLPCSHLFHYECIVEWMMRSNSCPLCRSQPAPPNS